MRCLALAVAAVLLPCLPASAQKTGQTIDVGGWKLSNELAKDGSTRCMAIFEYDDKSVIGFSTDNDKFTSFLVSEPTATLTDGQHYQVKYRVDRGAPVTGMGIAVSTKMVVVPVDPADIGPVFKSFMAGASLYVTVGKQEFEEPLDGSKDAITAMGKCADALPPRTQ